MPMLSPDQLEIFRNDGFLVVRGLFSPDEIAELRRGVYDVAGEAGFNRSEAAAAFALPGDLAAHTQLCHLITDERLVSLARQLVGEPPIHFRDSAVLIGGSDRGWHKDNRNSDRYDATAPDWDGDYRLVRMGIYCEDHVEHSGGLAVRVGSHRRETTWRMRRSQAMWGLAHRFRRGPYVAILASGMLASGRPVHVATRPGDLVVWNMRITHSGHTLRLKGLPWVKLPPAIEKRVPRALAKGEADQRVAAFLTYGADTPHTERFVEWLRTKPYFAERTRGRPPCSGVVEAANAAALRLVDPWADEVATDAASATTG